jgi:hypothetical protein
MARKLCAALALLALMGALPACQSRAPAERTGAAIDRAGTRTGQAVGRAADSTGAALERAGGWVQERTR